MSKIFISILITFITGTAHAVDPNYNFNDCSSFNVGFGIQATHEFQNQIKCFDTYSATEIKLETLALAIPDGVNYDIFVYWYNSATGVPEFKVSSTNLSNSNESAVDVLPAGNYLVYSRATTGFSSSAFIIGAIGNIDYDQYEMNDTALTSTQL